jgi:hypothetical protein
MNNTFQEYTRQARNAARQRNNTSSGASSSRRKVAQVERRNHEHQQHETHTLNTAHELGRCDVPCPKCGALHWLEERKVKSSKVNPLFSLCCSDGKVALPELHEPDDELKQLFNTIGFGMLLLQDLSLTYLTNPQLENDSMKTSEHTIIYSPSALLGQHSILLFGVNVVIVSSACMANCIIPSVLYSQNRTKLHSFLKFTSWMVPKKTWPVHAQPTAMVRQMKQLCYAYR